jgi:hypothetical protein
MVELHGDTMFDFKAEAMAIAQAFQAASVSGFKTFKFGHGKLLECRRNVLLFRLTMEGEASHKSLCCILVLTVPLLP